MSAPSHSDMVLEARRQRLLDLLNYLADVTHEGKKFFKEARKSGLLLVRGEETLFETPFPEVEVTKLDAPVEWFERVEGVQIFYEAKHVVSFASLLSAIADVLAGRRLSLGEGKYKEKEWIAWKGGEEGDQKESSRTVRGRFEPCPRCKQPEINVTVGKTEEGLPTADIRCAGCDWFVMLVGAPANWPTLHWNRAAADFLRREKEGPQPEHDWWCAQCCSGFSESDWLAACRTYYKVGEEPKIRAGELHDSKLCPNCDVPMTDLKKKREEEEKNP